MLVFLDHFIPQFSVLLFPLHTITCSCRNLLEEAFRQSCLGITEDKISAALTHDWSLML